MVVCCIYDEELEYKKNVMDIIQRLSTLLYTFLYLIQLLSLSPSPKPSSSSSFLHHTHSPFLLVQSSLSLSLFSLPPLLTWTIHPSPSNATAHPSLHSCLHFILSHPSGHPIIMSVFVLCTHY